MIADIYIIMIIEYTEYAGKGIFCFDKDDKSE